MKSYVGITDSEWFSILSNQVDLQEVNFWQPGGSRVFRALEVGELFLFKLHSPQDFIVGGGLYAHSSLLPVSLAWEAFGIGNGAHTLEQMRRRIEKYRRSTISDLDDYSIGCIILTQPFFLAQDSWIPIPTDWKSNIVQGRTYDLEVEPGISMFRHLENVIHAPQTSSLWQAEVSEGPILNERFGKPFLTHPRLGQGAFRVVVTDAYSRKCCVSAEKVLPVLQASHIRPYATGGEHRVENGLLLRSDLHVLFDRGYITVTPDLHVEVSRRIREEFENGRDYYALHGRGLASPVSVRNKPSSQNLQWHNEHIFKG